MWYVVYIHQRFQDGHEEHAKLFCSTEAAMTYINSRPDDPSIMTEYRLFEVGNEIPIEKKRTEIPQPPKTELRYCLKKRSKK